MAVFSICLYICLYIYAVRSYNGEYTEDFMDSTVYGGHLFDFATDNLDSEIVVNSEAFSDVVAAETTI